MSRFLPGFTPTSSRLNLQRLVLLRAALNSGELLVLLIGFAVLELPLPYFALLAVISLHILFNLFTVWRLQRQAGVDDRELFVHLVVDILLFAALLYLSGGATNPFAFLLLLPLTISATALAQRLTWSMAALAIGLYSLLMVFDRTWAEASAHGFHLHVLGMWLGFVLSAGLIAYFVAKMGTALREHEQRLAQLREQALRDERMVALGALAAGAAHELGTPLATMAVVSEELLHDNRDNVQLTQQLQLVRGQIDRCKKVLAELAERAGETPAAEGRRRRLQEYLDLLLDNWQQLHPDLHCTRRWAGPEGEPWIVADLSLDQALRNLLNNAADASPRQIEIAGAWNNDSLQLRIDDHGPGFQTEALSNAGQAVFSTKAQGRGLGLLLSQSTLTRFGGRIDFGNRADGGATVTVELPLARIKVDPA